MSLCAVLWLILGCQQPPQGLSDNDQLIAEVYNHRLFLSEIEPLLPKLESASDTLLKIRGLANQWVRETVLLHEAEQNVPSGMDIDDLVADYRSALIVDNFERSLVNANLDSTISRDELMDYYERNKDQYQLESPIVRCHFVRLPKPVNDREDFREWWDSDADSDFVQLIEYSNKHADVFILDDSTWYRVDEIQDMLPPGTLSSSGMRPGRSLQFTDDKYEYYLKISDSVLNTEVAPLSYIREQAIRYIMHKRKLELLKNFKSDLYEREIRGKGVKVYI